jgi:hypothetical protein
MKKVLCLLVLGAGLAGCGTTASQSEVWSHDTLYRDWDHMRFSWGGAQGRRHRGGEAVHGRRVVGAAGSSCHPHEMTTSSRRRTCPEKGSER